MLLLQTFQIVGDVLSIRLFLIRIRKLRRHHAGHLCPRPGGNGGQRRPHNFLIHCLCGLAVALLHLLLVLGDERRQICNHKILCVNYRVDIVIVCLPHHGIQYSNSAYVCKIIPVHTENLCRIHTVSPENGRQKAVFCRLFLHSRILCPYFVIHRLFDRLIGQRADHIGLGSRAGRIPGNRRVHVLTLLLPEFRDLIDLFPAEQKAGKQMHARKRYLIRNHRADSEKLS